MFIKNFEKKIMEFFFKYTHCKYAQLWNCGTVGTMWKNGDSFPGIFVRMNSQKFKLIITSSRTGIFIVKFFSKKIRNSLPILMQDVCLFWIFLICCTAQKGKTNNKYRNLTYDTKNVIRNTLVKFSQIGIGKMHTINCYKIICKNRSTKKRDF